MFKSFLSVSLLFGFAFDVHADVAPTTVKYAKNALVSRAPKIYAKLSLDTGGRLSVVQVDGPDQEIGHRRFITTKFLKPWERANRDDAEFIEDFFSYDARVFVVSRGAEWTPSKPVLNLHEMKFSNRRTLGAKFVVTTLSAFSLVWTLLPVPLVAAYLKHDPLLLKLMHSTVVNTIAAASYVGVLGTAIGGCVNALRVTRALRQNSKSTYVKRDDQVVHVEGIRRDAGGVWDVYLRGPEGTESLKALIDSAAL